MKVRIEFYRTRDRDDAHAVLGRAEREAANMAEAVGIATGLLRTMEMPQRPDGVTITDAEGNELYRGDLDDVRGSIEPAD